MSTSAPAEAAPDGDPLGAPVPFELRRTARYYALGAPSAPEVWVALHGYGQLSAYFGRAFRALAGPSRRVLVPEAPQRFYLDGPGGERVGAAWLTREDRAADARDAVGYLDGLVRHEVGAGRRGVRLCGFGFSQGGSVLCRWAAHGATRFDRLVLWGAAPPDDLDLAGHAARLAPLALVYGDADEYAPAERIAAVEDRLRAAGVGFAPVRYAGGHRLHAETLRAVVEGRAP